MPRPICHQLCVVWLWVVGCWVVEWRPDRLRGPTAPGEEQRGASERARGECTGKAEIGDEDETN